MPLDKRLGKQDRGHGDVARPRPTVLGESHPHLGTIGSGTIAFHISGAAIALVVQAGTRDRTKKLAPRSVTIGGHRARSATAASTRTSRSTLALSGLTAYRDNGKC